MHRAGYMWLMRPGWSERERDKRNRPCATYNFQDRALPTRCTARCCACACACGFAVASRCHRAALRCMFEAGWERAAPPRPGSCSLARCFLPIVLMLRSLCARVPAAEEVLPARVPFEHRKHMLSCFLPEKAISAHTHTTRARDLRGVVPGRALGKATLRVCAALLALLCAARRAACRKAEKRGGKWRVGLQAICLNAAAAHLSRFRSARCPWLRAFAVLCCAVPFVRSGAVSRPRRLLRP